ncbi:MAG TPA: hypothetical protein PLD82_10230 [Spirochaetota bacterium]|nr:hypothetical protein [Spirochaetota bacterium]HPH02856.1 hypothetical protein [Spirochaetota bacterium]
METLNFKGVDYRVEPISSKAEFDALYRDLLRKVNSGKSILKDLEKAYRISPSEVYLVRYDQERRALVPVRIAKESVDGLLIRNRYDDKAKTLQRGIGQEMAKHTQDIYDAVEKKKQLNEKNEKQIAERRAQEQKLVEIDGVNFQERLVWHRTVIGEIQGILRQHDMKYREDRDYKGKIDMAFEKIIRQVEQFEAGMKDIERDNGKSVSAVRHLLPADISKDNPPEGYVRMLQTYLSVAALNVQLEKEWTTLGEYVLDMAGLPVKVAQLVQMVGELINRTRLLTGAAERILFPEKYSFRRDSNAVYDFSKLSKDVVAILMHQ